MGPAASGDRGAAGEWVADGGLCGWGSARSRSPLRVEPVHSLTLVATGYERSARRVQIEQGGKVLGAPLAGAKSVGIGGEKCKLACKRCKLRGFWSEKCKLGVGLTCKLRVQTGFTGPPEFALGAK